MSKLAISIANQKNQGLFGFQKMSAFLTPHIQDSTKIMIKYSLVEEYTCTKEQRIHGKCFQCLELKRKIKNNMKKFFNPNKLTARGVFAGSGLALGAKLEIECMAIKRD